MQRQQFYAKQLIGVTEMMKLENDTQNGIDDALVSIGAQGIVSGLVPSAIVPPSWSYQISAGKAILEDGTIVNNLTPMTLTIDPSVITAPSSDILFYAIFLVPKKTQNTPIVTPDGPTINYIEFDDFNVVLVANGPISEQPDPAAVAGGGFTGIRIGDIIRRSGGVQTNLQSTDFILTTAEYVVQLDDENFFNLNALRVEYDGVLILESLTVNGNIQAQEVFVTSLVATGDLFAPALAAPDGSVSMLMSNGMAGFTGKVQLNNGLLAIGSVPPVITLNTPGAGVGATFSTKPGSNMIAGTVTLNTGTGLYVGSDGATFMTFNMPYACKNGWLLFITPLTHAGRDAASPPLFPDGCQLVQGASIGTAVQLNWVNVGLLPSSQYIFNYFLIGLN